MKVITDTTTAPKQLTPVPTNKKAQEMKMNSPTSEPSFIHSPFHSTAHPLGQPQAELCRRDLHSP